MTKPLIVGRDDLARLISVSTATFDRMNAAGNVGPTPIKLSAGRLGWRLETIERWVAESERVGELLDRQRWTELCSSGCSGGTNDQSRK